MNLSETPPSAPVSADPVPPASPVIPNMVPLPSSTPVRRYGFLCSYCSSHLEAHDALAGQSGNCPTCGNRIVIPILDRRGRLIDPSTGQIIKQDPLPVHAYAAAGARAPRIVSVSAATAGSVPNSSAIPAPGVPEAPPTSPQPRREDDPRPALAIECPRCLRRSLLHANHCSGCGLPFTMEGTNTPMMGASNGWAVASLILGIVGLTGGFILFGIPCLLSVIFGIIAIRKTQADPNIRGGMALSIAGFILGLLGLLLSFFLFVQILTR